MMMLNRSGVLMNGGMKKIVVVVLSVVLSVWYSVFECVVLMNGFDMM